MKKLVGESMSDWQRYKDQLELLGQRALNFDLERREEFTVANGWNLDQYEADLPPEPPGEPLERGSFAAASDVLREYRFPPPDLIKGIFVPDAPLEQRVMLLHAQFLGFNFKFGVRVNGVVSERVDQEWRWGYRYATLEGHFERGQIEFLIIKNLQTGAIKFKISAFSQTGMIKNPLYRLGFRLFGRRLQKRFARDSLRRMQLFVAEALQTNQKVANMSQTTSGSRVSERGQQSFTGVMMNIEKLTGLARPIDLRYPSNIFITVLATMTVAVLLLLTNPLTALLGAGWTFLTWSLGRELDPDQPLTAALAAGSVALLLYINPEIRAFSLAALCATGILMLAARAALGSTGLPLRPNDVLLLALSPTIAQVITGTPLSGLGLAALMALLVAPVPSQTIRGVGLGLSAVNIAWFLFSNMQWQWWMLGLLGLLALAALRAAPISRADNGLALEPKRWWISQAAVYTAAALTALATPPALWISLSLVGLLGFVLVRVQLRGRAMRRDA